MFLFVNFGITYSGKHGQSHHWLKHSHGWSREHYTTNPNNSCKGGMNKLIKNTSSFMIWKRGFLGHVQHHQPFTEQTLGGLDHKFKEGKQYEKQSA